MEVRFRILGLVVKRVQRGDLLEILGVLMGTREVEELVDGVGLLLLRLLRVLLLGFGGFSGGILLVLLFRRFCLFLGLFFFQNLPFFVQNIFFLFKNHLHVRTWVLFRSQKILLFQLRSRILKTFPLMFHS